MSFTPFASSSGRLRHRDQAVASISSVLSSNAAATRRADRRPPVGCPRRRAPGWGTLSPTKWASTPVQDHEIAERGTFSEWNPQDSASGSSPASVRRSRRGSGLTPLYVKNARGSTTARSVRGELKALALLGSRSPRTVNHGRQPAERVLRCAPALRVTAAADRAGSPCGPAGRLARDPLPGSATPASHSVVAENRRQTPEWDRVHLPDRGFAVARTIRKHAVGILAYLDTRMTERARGRTHPARPTG